MAGVPAVQRSEQRKIDAAWDLAAGYSAQFVSKRIECDAATLSRWLAEPEFAETVQL